MLEINIILSTFIKESRLKQRALKVRIYPTEQEINFLDAQFGAVRFVYNKALAIHKHFFKYHNLKLKTNKDIKPLLAVAKKSRKYPWLKEYDSLSLQESVRNLNMAFSNFFKKNARFPTFKKRNHKQSSYHAGKGIGVDFDNGTIKIPKIGQIKAILHKEMSGRLVSITLSKTSSGKYFASLLFEEEETAIKKQTVFQVSKILGIDLGLKHFIIDSNFNKVENPHFLLSAEKNLKRKQKQLSRKKKGSKNRARARILVAKIHEKIVNKRLDFFYKLAKQLVDENQAIIVESLKIKNLLRNRKLAKRISEVAWAKFIEILKRKTEEAGKLFINLDSFYPSSKLCSCCGYKNKELALKDRFWTCPDCNTKHDRDENASSNIKNEGKLEIMAAGQVVTAC